MRLLSIFAGGVLSILSSLAAGCLIAPRATIPLVLRFTAGAILYSACIFALLCGGMGYPVVYLISAVLLIAAAARARAAFAEPLPKMGWMIRIVVLAYGLMYLVYALAPETQPDGFGYHLRLVAGYARLHAFTHRAAFFDVLPEPLEMLFVPAFSLGGAAAAKLVHFAFLVATVPLLREIARELGVSDKAGSVAAALFFLAPVCGVAGTSAYTDAALVCAACSLLYFLIRWDKDRLTRTLCLAGINAGGCYAIKPTFGLAAFAAFSFVALRGRRAIPAIAFAAIAALVALPWALRAYLLTGNPTAPFLNAWFPNPVSTPELEKQLAMTFSAFRPGFSWQTAFFNYTVSGGNQGLLGAAFLMLPLAVLSLRRPAGKWLVSSCILLALPVLTNTGTRFLMPAIAPASIGMAMVLPAPVGIAAVLIQAIGAAPPVIELYDSKQEWRLPKLPLKAALGLEPEYEYLKRSIPGFAVAGMIADNTNPNARIFACAPLPEFYIPREILTWWHSGEAQRFTDALRFAHDSQGSEASLVSWRWKDRGVRLLRVTAANELRIVEAAFAQGPAPSQSWRVLRPGESATLMAPPGIAGADLLISPDHNALGNAQALSASGAWRLLDQPSDDCRRKIDLRRDATAWIGRIGYEYLVIPVENDGFAEIGADMAHHPDEWGLEATGRSGNLWLFRIYPKLP